MKNLDYTMISTIRDHTWSKLDREFKFQCNSIYIMIRLDSINNIPIFRQLRINLRTKIDNIKWPGIPNNEI